MFFGDNLNPLEQFFEGKALDEFPMYARTSAANRKDLTFQMSPEMVKKMMANGERVRNAVVKSTNSKNQWRPGDKGLTFGKGGDIQTGGWFSSGICAKISWNGSDHVLKRSSRWTSIRINGQQLKADVFLTDGDVFVIGASEFQFRNASE